jgi:hypothetical protein
MAIVLYQRLVYNGKRLDDRWILWLKGLINEQYYVMDNVNGNVLITIRIIIIQIQLFDHSYSPSDNHCSLYIDTLVMNATIRTTFSITWCTL